MPHPSVYGTILMNTTANGSPDKQNVALSPRSFPVRNYFLMGLAVFALCATFLYSRALIGHLSEVNTSYVIPAGDLKFQATLAHLWAEEAISGDKEVTPAMVRDYFNIAEQKTEQLLTNLGAGWWQNKLTKETDLPELLVDIKKQIAANRLIAAERLANPTISQPGSPADQRQDAAFETLLTDLSKFDRTLTSVVISHYRVAKNIQQIMIGLTLILGLLAVLVIYRFQNQRSGYLRLIVSQNTELQALNQQLLASEQQLLAYNQQLMATEQQLLASNQQMMATEQQLRATNEQLAASEHALRAKNRELVTNQQILQASEQRYRTLVGNMSEGVAIHRLEYDIDDKPVDYRILEVNGQYEKILGCRRDEVIGRLASDLYGTNPAPYLKVYAEVAEGAAPTRFETYFPPLDRYFSISVSSFEPGHFATVFFDISEQKRAEEAIKANETRLESLLEISQSQVTAPELLLENALQTALLLTGSNHGGIFLYDPTSKSLTRTASSCSPHQNCGILDQTGQCGIERLPLLEETLKRQAPVIINDKNQATPATCGEFPLPFKRCMVVPLLFDGVIRGIIILGDKESPYDNTDVRQTTLLMDSVLRIAERRQAIEERFHLEVQLQKLESLGVLAGGIAHDFNNMLTAVLANINLAVLAGLTGQELVTRLTEAERATLRAKGLAQQLLTFARGGTPIKKVMLLPELITETATFAVSGSGTKCIFNFTDELWPVEIDGGQVGQAVNNLVLNAVQAMHNGGVVHISADNVLVSNDDKIPLQPGKYVRLLFEDHGVGIPAEILPKIFDPYFTTKDQGNGLGLAASHAIILNHRGSIQAKSQVGKGTSITVYLPATQAALPTVEGTLPIPQAEGGRVLVMDDEIALQNLMAILLQDAGYLPTITSDGEEAIQVYRAAREQGEDFDIVILDLTISGGMGGRETLRHLMDIDPDVQAIVCSGYSNDPIMADYQNYGFKGVIAKPYTVHDVLHELYRVMGATVC